MAACTACGRPHAADRACPERAQNDRVGQIVGGKYEVVRHIGEGGMASVYEARHVEIKRPFALKFLHPWLCSDDEWLERFKREAAAGGALISEHITAIVDIGVAPDDTPYIVMEFLTGEDLGQRLAREITLKPPDAIEIVIQACCGLGVAHAAGVVHRDLKPENLFLCDRQLGGCVVKILDFGIAKLRSAQAQVTRAGMVIGTPFYMSPEQAAGRWDVDHRSDIYALGVILYELLSGEKPFVGESNSTVLGEIINGPTPALRDQCPTVSAELARVVERAMSKSARDRFQTAAEFAEALHAFSPQARRSSRTANSFGSKASWRALSAPSMTVAEPNLTVRLSGTKQRNSSPGPQPNLGEGAPGAGRSGALVAPEQFERVSGSDFEDSTSVDAFVEEHGSEHAASEQAGSDKGASVSPRQRAMVGSHPIPIAGAAALVEGAIVPRAVPSVNLWRTVLPLVAGVAAIVLLVASFSSGSSGGQSEPVADPTEDSSSFAGSSGVARSEEDVVRPSAPKLGEASAQVSEGIAVPANPTSGNEPTAESSGTGASQAAVSSAPTASGEGLDVPPGLLNVHSEPSAELFIGSRSRGHTPITGLRLPPGEYSLVLVEPGRGRRIKTVRIQSRQLTAVTVRFDELAQAIAPGTGTAPAGSAGVAPLPTVPIAGKGCSPRFFIDADGVKRVKPECLF
jgi:serine/threonine protein kinase